VAGPTCASQPGGRQEPSCRTARDRGRPASTGVSIASASHGRARWNPWPSRNPSSFEPLHTWSWQLDSLSDQASRSASPWPDNRPGQLPARVRVAELSHQRAGDLQDGRWAAGAGRPADVVARARRRRWPRGRRRAAGRSKIVIAPWISSSNGVLGHLQDQAGRIDVDPWQGTGSRGFVVVERDTGVPGALTDVDPSCLIPGGDGETPVLERNPAITDLRPPMQRAGRHGPSTTVGTRLQIAGLPRGCPSTFLEDRPRRWLAELRPTRNSERGLARIGCPARPRRSGSPCAEGVELPLQVKAAPTSWDAGWPGFHLARPLRGEGDETLFEPAARIPRGVRRWLLPAARLRSASGPATPGTLPTGAAARRPA